jgi:hypothetical protein
VLVYTLLSIVLCILIKAEIATFSVYAHLHSHPPLLPQANPQCANVL